MQSYFLVGFFGLIYLGARSALGDPFEVVQFAQGYVLPILLVGLLIGSFYAVVATIRARRIAHGRGDHRSLNSRHLGV